MILLLKVFIILYKYNKRKKWILIIKALVTDTSELNFLKSEMTIEQRDNLRSWTDEVLEKAPKELDKVRGSIRMINYSIQEWGKMFSDETDNSVLRGFENVRDLGRCRLLVGFVMLDLTTSLRIYLNAKYDYEILYSIRHMTVIIKEGFQNIYHYNDKGRNKNSYWMLYFHNLINHDLPELRQVFNELTNQLDSYLEVYLSDNYIKNIRDYTVHYDRVSEDVYDKIAYLDINRIFNVLIPFFGLIDKLFKFTNTMTTTYLSRYELENEHTNGRLDKRYYDFEMLKAKISHMKDQETKSKLFEMISKVQKVIKDTRDSK